MSLVVPNIGDILMLQYIVNMIGQDGNAAPAGGQRLLRLFVNNQTPGKSDTLTTYTEASGAGYAPITLVGTSWTTVSTNGVNSAVYSQQVFSFTTAVTIYGYYVTTIGASPQLLWVERFSGAPFSLPAGGGQIAISPTLSLN